MLNLKLIQLMKKKLLVMLLVLGTATYAQVGVGTLVPNTSTMLDVVAANKGIMIPRIQLKNTTDVTTISTGNVESLLVYNTQLIADVKPGYYYWANNKWNKIISIDDVVAPSAGSKLVDNGDGTFTHTNEKGVSTLIDVPAVVKAKTVHTLAADTNTLTSGVNGISVTAPIVNSNTLSAKSGRLISTVNGIDSNTFDLKDATAHSLTVSGGVLTSTVNGISPTANVLSTVDNGLIASAGNVRLGGTLNSPTILTTTATGTLALAGLQRTGISPANSVLVVDANTGILKVISGIDFMPAITTVTSNYTAFSLDETILVNASAGAVTITLPYGGASQGKKFNIKKIDSSNNSVIIKAMGGKIDTVNSISGNVWLQSWSIQSDGENWYVISRN